MSDEERVGQTEPNRGAQTVAAQHLRGEEPLAKASVAGKILHQVRPHKPNTGPLRYWATCIRYGHRWTTASTPIACARCGKTTRPVWP